jgi:hypothetical protein
MPPSRSPGLTERLLRLARDSFARAIGEDSAGDRLRGQWVALDRCRYEGGFDQPVSGVVVDSDPDLAELCARLRTAGDHRCVILLCDASYALDSAARVPTLRRSISDSPCEAA